MIHVLALVDRSDFQVVWSYAAPVMYVNKNIDWTIKITSETYNFGIPLNKYDLCIFHFPFLENSFISPILVIS